MNADRERAWFSPLLNRIADVAGERAALLLGREKACQVIYVPRDPTPDHWIPRLIGVEAARALGEAFGGQKLEIPPALNGQKRQRDRTIAEMNGKGYSINQITQALGVARSTVKDHRRRFRAAHEDDQGSLF